MSKAGNAALFMALWVWARYVDWRNNKRQTMVDIFGFHTYQDRDKNI